jgi:cytochrome c oxidase subunit 1
MLFALGFVSLFITGGLTGPILAQPILDEYLHNTFFVVAHFHLIMAMAGVFGLFAGTYYWFPLITSTHKNPDGRLMSERLGKAHFYATFIGAYATFLPMHATGLAGQPRHYAQLTGLGPLTPAGHLLSDLIPLNRFITYAAIFLASAQLLFLYNLARSLWGGRAAPSNPWRATTLEWHMRLSEWSATFADGAASNQEIAVYRSPCEYFGLHGESFAAQWQLEEPSGQERE